MVVIVVNLVVLYHSIIHSIKLQIKRRIAKKRYEEEKKRRDEMAAKGSIFDFNPDKDELERRINAVNLKAKQTSYLDVLRSPGRGKILANMAPNI